jgi:hypothetical protein
MEALLIKSGIIPDDDGGRTDLAALERKLSEHPTSKGDGSRPGSARPSHDADSHQSTPLPHEQYPSPHNPTATPASEKGKERDREKEKEVEALSDMMCSLVTNNCGETRYIGTCKP